MIQIQIYKIIFLFIAGVMLGWIFGNPDIYLPDDEEDDDEDDED